MDGTLHVLPFMFLIKKRLKACTVSVVYVNFSKNSFFLFAITIVVKASAKIRGLFYSHKLFEDYFSKISIFLLKIDINQAKQDNSS